MVTLSSGGQLIQENATLRDHFGRTIEYLRISVTDRCDLRCVYCIPKDFDGFEEPNRWLSFGEIERVVSAFARLGLRRVRLTGGEPLLRRNLADLAARLSKIRGIQDLSLSTNATQLARHAAALEQAGISRINVSLDSLKSERIRQITGRDALQDILSGLMAAKRHAFNPIKINMVVMGGINEDEVDDMVGFCMRNGFVLRLIEAMPMGQANGRAQYVDLGPIQDRLQQRFGLQEGNIPGGGPARYLESPDASFTVGFITPISQHFCATCNRVRLSASGTLFLCLGNEENVELRPLLRSGGSDEHLDRAIRSAIFLKPRQHDFVECRQASRRIMAKTGG